MDPRFTNPPHIRRVDVPEAARMAFTSGVPVSYARPNTVPARTTGPTVQTPGGPVTRTTIRSYAEALAQKPGEATITLTPMQVREAMTAIRANWVSDFERDAQIGGPNRDRTVARGTALIDQFGREVGAQHAAELRSVLDDTGAGDHRALLRLADWMAGKLIRRGAGSARPKAAVSADGKADRLYRRTAA